MEIFYNLFFSHSLTDGSNNISFLFASISVWTTDYYYYCYNYSSYYHKSGRLGGKVQYNEWKQGGFWRPGDRSLYVINSAVFSCEQQCPPAVRFVIFLTASPRLVPLHFDSALIAAASSSHFYLITYHKDGWT